MMLDSCHNGASTNKQMCRCNKIPSVNSVSAICHSCLKPLRKKSNCSTHIYARKRCDFRSSSNEYVLGVDLLFSSVTFIDRHLIRPRDTTEAVNLCHLPITCVISHSTSHKSHTMMIIMTTTTASITTTTNQPLKGTVLINYLSSL